MSAPLPSAEFIPSDQTVWQKFNPRLELPISFSTSALAFTLIMFLFSLFLWHPWTAERKAVAISLYDGPDLFGAGSPAANSGPADPIHRPDPPKANDPPLQAKAELAKPADNDPVRVGTPGSNVAVPDASRDYLVLDESLRNKLLGKDSGDKPGAKAGTGADATLARSLRWVLKFRVADGKEYVEQLAVLKATILIPVPPDNRKMMMFDDLTAHKPGQIASDADIGRYAKLMRFTDSSDEAVREVSKALGWTGDPPKAFFVFFPKGFEDELAKKERDYKGRKPDEIQETVFKVTVRKNTYEVTVQDQKLKK